MNDAELRELAEAVTPEPWDPMRPMGDALAMRRPIIPLRDAHYIAAANPATVLALLDRIDAVRALHTYVDGFTTPECTCGLVYPCPTIRALDGES